MGIAGRDNQEGTDSIQCQAHHDAAFITVFTGYERSRCSENEISAKIGCLQQAGSSFCNSQLVLEILVHDVDQAITEAPEQKQRRNQDKRDFYTFIACTWHTSLPPCL